MQNFVTQEICTIFWPENLKGRELGKSRSRWEDNITTDLREIWWEGVEWIHLAQDRNQWQVIVNMVMNPQVPYKTEFLD
jgi:hypothetical protein